MFPPQERGGSGLPFARFEGMLRGSWLDYRRSEGSPSPGWHPANQIDYVRGIASAETTGLGASKLMLAVVNGLPAEEVIGEVIGAASEPEPGDLGSPSASSI